jgi:Ca-activated chloride channel family protein
MKDQSIEARLAELNAPTPDADARLQAKRAALVEFARVHAANQELSEGDQTTFKAFWNLARLFRDDKSPGRSTMNWSRNRTLVGSVASVCVLAFGAVMLWPVFTHRGELPMVQEPVRVDVSPGDTRSEPEQQVPVPEIPAPPADNSRKLIPTPPPVVRARADNAPNSPLEKKKDEKAQEIIVSGSRTAVNYSVAPKAMMIQAATVESMTAPGYDGVQQNDDKFAHFDVNPVKTVASDPVSTFSIDVDTASYSFARRMLNEGVLPEKDAIRVEEMVNYFDYAWPVPDSRKEPFEPTIVVTDSPWGAGKKLIHIGIKGYEMNRDQAPDVNLVLLLDVSGSMNSPDKLPLAVKSMELLLESLKPTDTVGIVVYAGAAGTVLEPTPVGQKQKIVEALRSLQPGGSTAGAAGIERAYQLAEAHFRKGGVNRILLATDGDFNVGTSGTEQLKGLVERKRENGVFLSVLGFGEGNYRDELAQALAQNGNGVAAYIDTLSEAQKVLVQESNAALFTIAKDVKLQVEFNPATVAEYRLVGYESRALRREDFNNDAIDAGDVGSGHTVTAIYEITPVGSAAVMVDENRYAENDRPAPKRGSRDEYGFLKIRYKLPNETQSRLLTKPIAVRSARLSEPVRRDVQFSTAVAGFAQLLRGGTYTGALTYDDIIRQAQGAKGEDRYGYREEFVQLVRKAQLAKGQ